MIKTPLAILLALTTQLWAAPVAKPVECKLLRLQTTKGGTPTMFAGPADAAIQCDVPQEEISRSVMLPSLDGRIEFRSTPDAAPIAVATLPAGFKGGLLLFLPKPAAGGTKTAYQVLVLDDSAVNLPKDGSFIYNACPAEIRFLIGDRRGNPKPGKITAVARPEKRNAYQMSGVLFQIHNGDTWRTIYESMLRFPENQHRLFVAYIDPVTMLPAMRILRFTPR